MFIGILFCTMYVLTSACTAWATQAIFNAYLSAHPRTRDLNIDWISWPLGVLAGIIWPLTIPVAIIIAGVMK